MYILFSLTNSFIKVRSAAGITVTIKCVKCDAQKKIKCPFYPFILRECLGTYLKKTPVKKTFKLYF